MARRRFQPNRRPRRTDRPRRARGAAGDRAAPAVLERHVPSGPVELPATMTVGELAEIISQSPVDTIKALMRHGLMVTVNEVVDFETAAIAAATFEVPVLKPKEREESTAGSKVGVDEQLSEENAAPRPPVVTVLGHVDHGKTTLLDAIRGANVVDTEAGGITQRIGAYQVERDAHVITFVDTPGHEAFTAMRASGAQVTDIAVLVVAADDGVMPQTIEAIDHAHAAQVPIVVAINKIDTSGADTNRLKAQLAEHNVIVEDYGGDIVAVEVSALKKQGIDNLLEAILLVSEIAELKGNPDRPGVGVVIESNVDRSRGAIATVLVRSGTVRVGDNIVAGTSRGRVRAMSDGFSKQVREAGPSSPAEILGLDNMPRVGDPFEVVADERTGRQLVETRERIAARRRDVKSAPTLAEVMRRVQSGEFEEMPLVVKSGTQGSVDAVRRSVEQISNEDVRINVLHAAAGAVNDSDVMLAAASGGIIVGFQTETEAGAGRQAAVKGVEIRHYEIIYNLIEDVSAAAQGLIEPEEHEVVIGHAAVQQIFSAGRRNRAAGIRVVDGHLLRNASVRVLRGGEQMFEGRIASMRRFKEDVRELATGFEGGVLLQGFNEFEAGDILEAFQIEVASR